MRAVLLVAVGILLACHGTAEAATASNHPYRTRWKKSVVGKGALGKVAVGAGVAQLRHKPAKYGGGISGFGKRLGAGFATNAVGKTVEHGIAAKLHEDLNYHRSNQKGVRRRLAHALKSTVITRNTRTGKHRPAAGRLAGHAASGAFVQGALAAGSGASTAGLGLAADAGANVVREFLPRRHHRSKR